MFLHRFSKTKAPEFPANLEWLNSKSLSLSKLRGKVILLDFWTYSCVNCIRTFPHLKRWHKTYKDKDFIIIGVHTPEFEFEKDSARLKQALKKYGISYPVVMDNDYKIWKSYQNKWWPRHFLIDANGFIVYDHVGEGGYAETEQAIQKALQANGKNNLPQIPPDESIGGKVCYRTTPELYLGYARGNYGNTDIIKPHSETAYSDTNHDQEDTPYLYGHFKVEAEYTEHSKDIAGYNEYIQLKYSAFGVNLVIDPGKHSGIKLKVELDNQPLAEDMIGSDIKIENGESFLHLDKARMYEIVNADTYHSGRLKIKIQDSGIRFYAFTFNSCEHK